MYVAVVVDFGFFFTIVEYELMMLPRGVDGIYDRNTPSITQPRQTGDEKQFEQVG